ncbi:pilin [Candidatus Saccharibacteria bacterium]|nr:pilin [Candidatus Saccharibacteria bacterium]
MTKLSNKLKIVMGTVLMVVGVAGVALPAWADVTCPDGSTASSSAGCAAAGADAVDPDGGSVDLMNVIQAIINTVIFVVGIIAVVMIILGGIQYSTSQGDSGKVKKAKDTIMYGIIGLIVALLAFTIVNFVLSSVF